MSILTRSTTATSTALPEGHNDKSSHWFIPTDLIEHYEPDFDELTVMDESRRKSAAYQVSGPAEFLLDFVRDNPKEPVPPRIRSLVQGITPGKRGSFQDISELALQSLTEEIDRTMTWEERCWAYHMRVLLPAARSRKVSAEARAVIEAARVKRQTCAVCGEDKPDTTARGITAAGRLLRGPGTRGSGLTVQACEMCAQAVHEEFLERGASVNGKKRRELAAAWLDRNTR